MNVETSYSGSTAVAVVDGRIDSANAKDFDEELSAVIDRGVSSLVVDCGGLNYISSAGLRVLLIAIRKTNEAGGGLALGLGPSVALTDRVGAIETVIELPGEPESNRTNDGAVDPRGRLFQGTLSGTEPGAPVASLHRVDGDGTVRRVLSDVMISNGIGWSPDQSTMYYIDSLTFRVDRFDYDPDTGEIEGRRPFVTFDGSAGGPDGMTVDADGCLWVAMFGGYQVQRFSPGGEPLETVITPGSPLTTCCCFAGPDLDTLYITTGREALAGISTEGEPNAGALFAAEVDAVGQPTNLFAG